MQPVVLVARLNKEAGQKRLSRIVFHILLHLHVFFRMLFTYIEENDVSLHP